MNPSSSMRLIRQGWHFTPYPLRMMIVAALYFVTAKIGLQFATVGQNVTLVWPPAGVAVAVLLLSNFRLWPGIVLGIFIVHITTGFALPELIIVTVGNTLEAVSGVYLLRRFAGFHLNIDRARDVLGFVAFAVFLCPFIGAAFGVLALLAQNEIQPASILITGLTWWAGDAMGILIVAPPLLLWAAEPRQRWSRLQSVEALTITLAATAMSILVFRHYADPMNIPLAYLTFPFLVWVALRFGQRGTASIALIIAIIAVWATGDELGPFARADLNQSEFSLSIFIVVETIISMLLAAVLAENKRVTEELKRERDFATQVMKALGQGVTVTGANGRFEFVNAAYARMTGYQLEDLIGKTPMDFTLPEDRSVLEKAYQDRKSGQSTTYEARLLHADGRIIHTLISGSPRWQGDVIKGAIASVTDLTRQKYIENALRESEARLQAAIENLPFHLWATDATGRYVLQSPISVRQWGNFIGKTFEDLKDLRPDMQETWRENNRRVLAGETLRGEVQYPVNGEERYFYYITSPIRSGDAVLGILGVDIDVTDLKRSEEALRKSEARFRSVFEGASIGIAVIDRSGRSTSVNPRLIEMLGYSEDEFHRMTFSEFTHPEDVPNNLALFKGLLAGENNGYQFEKRYIRKDGEIVWVRIQVSPFPSAHPDRDFAIALIENITERKQAQDALNQLTAELEQRVIDRTAELELANRRLTELDRLKTKFIADVSHELRTPLAVLNTRVYLLEHAPPEKHPVYLNDLKLQIERLTHFVNTILDLSRLELGADKVTFGQVNIGEIATQVVAALAPRAELAGLSLDLYMDEALPPVRGELNQLAQVATNLIANAINYTPNGNIHVSVCLDKIRHQVCFEVQDTGLGIHADDLPHLFERFYRGERASQSNIPGSGLGLSIVKEIVDLHKGEIQVMSEVGKGSRFLVRFPLWQD